MGGGILLELSQCENSDNCDWIEILSELLPTHSTVVWEEWKAENPIERSSLDQVEYAITWTIPFKELSMLPKLRAVLLLGAGTDHITDLHELPERIPVIRLVDGEVVSNMAAYAVHWVTHFHFCFDQYIRLQVTRSWKQFPAYVPRKQFTVGVLGMGHIGKAVCNSFLALGYRVQALSRSRQCYMGVKIFDQDQMQPFLSECNALVNVLPLTDETSGLLDVNLLQMLPRGAIFINIGRGATVVDDAVCRALDSEHLKAAVLDVFHEEPLSPSSPFWTHEKVVVTPHISGRPFGRSSAKHIVENIKRIERGDQPFPVVDRKKLY
ncbi:unnamed protein product [Agarophyton chilense]|eukprot:gb/GEZJ01005905.1/.p2 GENE.gb/GEZJ01005905.1/~~gb/GEZJ01005905.1/.p2  ORF type:complete len:323 (+),score=27.69 gb/GEZJ01005905.1/:142-1110(+)